MDESEGVVRMVRGLGRNVNVDFNRSDLQSICTELKDEPLAIEVSNYVLTLMEGIINDLQSEKDSHECTLNVLHDTMKRLKEGDNTNALIKDIEQYLDDVKGVE